MFDLFRRESSVKIANKIEQLCVLLLQERNKLAGYSLAWSSCSPWSSWPPHEASQHMIFLLNITRTDNLGESREEAKKLLEEVEAMEREAHQVVKERYLWWSLLSFSSLSSLWRVVFIFWSHIFSAQVSDRCMRAVKACQGFDTTRNPLRWLHAI